MRKGRFSEEQIIAVLKEHQAGIPVVELCRKHGISDATFYTWRSKYGGMEQAGTTSRPASRCRTPSSSPSTAASAMKASMSVYSAACRWRAGSSKHGGSTNARRPHTSLGGFTPNEFAARSRKDHNQNGFWL